MIELSLKVQIVLAVILGPIVETLIFQFYLIPFIGKLTDNKKLPIIISALIFGLAHFTSIYYGIDTFIFGLIINTAYVYS